MGRDRPQLIVVGASKRAEAVTKVVDSLRVRRRQVASPEALEDPLRAAALGVVLVAASDRDVQRDVRTARVRAPEVPLFVVLADDPPSRIVRRLYESGVAGVFEWPREKNLLPRFLAEMLSLRIVRGRAARADTALARAVRTHLKLLLRLPALPSVESRDGLIWLRGEVDSLAAKRDVERCVAAVPGVRGLDTDAIRVAPEPVPDAAIRRALRRLLRRSDAVDERTLSLSVDAGRVALTGTVQDRREMLHLADLATNLQGVRDVELRILVAERATRANRSAARRLAGLLEDVFPNEELRVAFFRGVAVLTGQVSKLEVKRSVGRFVAEDDAVERVVNKLEVGGKPAARG